MPMIETPLLEKVIEARKDYLSDEQIGLKKGEYIVQRKKTKNDQQIKSYREAANIINDLLERTEKKDLEKAMAICKIGKCEECNNLSEGCDKGEDIGYNIGYADGIEEYQFELEKIFKIVDEIKRRFT